MNLVAQIQRFRAWALTSDLPEVRSILPLLDDPRFRVTLEEVIARYARDDVDRSVPTSAGLVIWKPGTADEEAKVLLVKPTNSGGGPVYSFPKGAIEAGEDARAAALRETKEEIGLDFRRYPLHFLGIEENKRGAKIIKRVHLFAVQAGRGVAETIPPTKLQKEEVSWAGFVPVSKAKAKLVAYLVPALDRLGDHWGDRRASGAEGAVPLAANTDQPARLTPTQHQALRDAINVAGRGSIFGLWRNPGDDHRVFLRVYRNNRIYAFALPLRAGAAPIEATTMPLDGAEVYDVDRALREQPVAYVAVRTPAQVPLQPEVHGAPSPDWYVGVGAQLEQLREATEKHLADLGFPDYEGEFAALEYQRTGPMGMRYVKQVKGEERAFYVAVKLDRGALSLQTSFTIGDAREDAKKTTVRLAPRPMPAHDLTPEDLFPEEWVLEKAVGLRARASKYVAERMGVAEELRTADRDDPDLWERVKAKITAGSKGGNPGQWSARKAQIAVAEYKRQGGGYIGERVPDNALTAWTEQGWRTRSGRPSLETGERYLPAQAIAALSPQEYGATTRAKRAGMARGTQYVPQPKRIAAKTAPHRSVDERCPYTPGTDVKAYMLKEHAEIHELIDAIQNAKDAEERTLRLRQLHLDVDQHFLSEEREVFGILRQKGFETADLEAMHRPILDLFHELRDRWSAAKFKRLVAMLLAHAHAEEVRFGWSK